MLLVTPLAEARILKRPEGDWVIGGVEATLIGPLYEPLTGLDGFVTFTVAVLELFGFDERPVLKVGSTENELGEIAKLIVTFVSPADMLSGVGLSVSLRTLSPPLGDWTVMWHFRFTKAWRFAKVLEVVEPTLTPV